MDIVTFLNARLDEREAIARAAAEEAGGSSVFGEQDRIGQWSATADGIYADAGHRNGPFAVEPYGSLAEEIGTHIALHDPASVLRDIAATRQHIAWLGPWAMNPVEPYDPHRAHLADHAFKSLRHLAMPYAEHADFHPAWRIRD